MVWIWKACIAWFGNLPLKTKLYMSFGWSCLFTVVLGVVCLAGAAHAMIVLLLGFILLLDVAMAWRLTQLITRPILDACGVLRRLAAHDLTATVRVESRDEAGRMAAALNDTIAHLREILAGLRDSSEALSGAAGMLHDRTSRSSDYCRLQNEMSAKVLYSTRQLSESGEAIAHSSDEAAAFSRDSVKSARAGLETMSAAVEAMSRIAQSTETVREHMRTLDQRSTEIGRAALAIREISENTNLLALNAAIEAARAGEQGRGFAVVANEVRRLAESAHSVTGEIERAIAAIQAETAQTREAMESSVAAIDAGQAQTDQARQVLERISGHAARSLELAEAVAGSARAQSAASQQIDESAARVSELASESLSCSSEVAATGATLRSSAEHLREVVGQFRL